MGIQGMTLNGPLFMAVPRATRMVNPSILDVEAVMVPTTSAPPPSVGVEADGRETVLNGPLFGAVALAPAMRQPGLLQVVEAMTVAARPPPSSSADRSALMDVPTTRGPNRRSGERRRGGDTGSTIEQDTWGSTGGKDDPPQEPSVCQSLREKEKDLNTQLQAVQRQIDDCLGITGLMNGTEGLLDWAVGEVVDIAVGRWQGGGYRGNPTDLMTFHVAPLACMAYIRTERLLLQMLYANAAAQRDNNCRATAFGGGSGNAGIILRPS